jgi:tRNA(Ile)-lysidine synthetase-like protein
MKSIPKKIETDFAASLASLIKDGCQPFRIIAAFSGGPDSTALLMLLDHFRKKYSYDLAAAYVNHGIRSHSECQDEEARVESLCRQHNIPIYTKRYDPGFLEYYSKLKGCGLEAAARTYRYHHFEKVSSQSELPVLCALGHNRNDQVETVIMRLFSGSSLEGLKGIPVKRGRYIRPLLDTARKDIEEYLEKQNIEAVLDKSNLKTDFLRNKVRLDLLNTIQESFPAAQDSLLSFQHDLKDVLEHYNSLLEESCPWTALSGETALSCKTSDFSRLPSGSRKRMILDRMNKIQKGLYSSDRRIPSGFFKPLSGALKSGIILKGYGILFEKKGEILVLRLHDEKLRTENQYTFYNLDSEHPYETDSAIIQFCSVSDLKENDRILHILPPVDSRDRAEKIVIRNLLSDSELKTFPVNRKETSLLLFCGNKALCVVNMEEIILPKAGKFKKIVNIKSKSNVQCVIIRDRGHYAPGR